jgi:hypothetical protein
LLDVLCRLGGDLAGCEPLAGVANEHGENGVFDGPWLDRGLAVSNQRIEVCWHEYRFVLK